MAGNFYAVLIGNRDFPSEPGLPSLRCPLNDVKGMAELLRAEQHGPYQVSVLEDEEHHVVHREIYRALKRAGREDRVLIYYAGHGKLSEDDGSLYLATRNTQLDYLPATSVAAADVMKFMNTSASRQLIFILDCCYSGAVDKLLSGSVFRGEIADQIAGSFRGAGGSGSYILTASTSLQRAEEREGDENGLLTKHLIAGIRDGRADRDDDGLISMHELTQYVQDQVRSEGRQTPLCYTLREEDGGIIIAKTGKAARARKLAELLAEIYATAAAHRASLRTVRSALTLLVPEPAASIEDKALCSQFVDRLHLAIRDSHQFIEVLEDAPAIVSRITLAATHLQQAAAEQQRDEARQQLQTAVEQQESLRAEGETTSKLLREANTNASQMAGQIDSLRSQLQDLQKRREEDRAVHKAAEKELQLRLAERQRRFTKLEAQLQVDPHELEVRNIELYKEAERLTRELAAEREHKKDRETELNSLRRIIAESNAAIEKLTQQLKEERSGKTALAKEKGNAGQVSAQKSEIITFFDKLPKKKTHESVEAKSTYEEIALHASRKEDASSLAALVSSPPNTTSKPRLPDSEFWKMVTRPSRREALLTLFQEYSSEPNFYVSPAIPDGLLTQASSGIDLGGREVLALATNLFNFSFGPKFILFDTDALYWSRSGGTESLRYAEIDPGNVKKEGVTVSVNEKLITTGLHIKVDFLIPLIKALATLKP